ncbi:MAG: hypothetical protein ABIH90_02360, partial [Candidatus Aenigmatarchaeota archaeon]
LNDFAIGGEFFSKGGPTDSPPIIFVNNISEAKERIDAGTYAAETYRFNICSWAYCANKDSGPNSCVVDGTVVCEKNCNIEQHSGLNDIGDGKYEVVGNSVDLSVNCIPKCILFIDRKEQFFVPIEGRKELTSLCNTTLKKAYGYMDISANWQPPTKTRQSKYASPSEPGPTFAPLETSFSLGVKEIPEEPNIETEFFAPKSVIVGEEFFLRAKVTNTGDQKAYIRGVDIGDAQGRILYMPRELAPGESDDVIVKVKPTTTGGVTLGMDYEAENLGCLTARRGSQTFSTDSFIEHGEACSFDSDCPSGSCCDGVCRSGSGVCDDIDGDGVLDFWVSG